MNAKILLFLSLLCVNFAVSAATETMRNVRDYGATGDGKTLDSTGTPIYDAYPTHGSPGFDLSGVGVINAAVPEPNAAAAIFAIAAAAFAVGKLRKKSS